MTRIRDSIDPRRRRSSGQSMVEFVLVFPILMVLLVAVADFGRIFAAGVVVEAAARDAAEIAAQHYISNPPGDLATAAPAPPPVGYYSALHAKAVRAACIETKNLPNSRYDPATEGCPGMPLTFVCVHDGADDQCASEAQGQTPPSGCSEMATSPTNTQSASAPQKRWVEVRVCYRFNTILNIPVTLFNEFFIQRQRSFTIACWLKTGVECG